MKLFTLKLWGVCSVIGFLVCFNASNAKAIEVSFESDSSLPLVYVNLAVRSGAVSDPKGQSGLTNFMGELMLRGSRSKTKEQIDKALDQMGARLEVETRSEALIFRGAVLSSQLEPFLNLVSEIITEPSFPDEEIRKLKSEVISGILEELGRDPGLAGRRATKFLFGDHPYGKPVLGTVKDIEKLSRDEIAEHYGKLIKDKFLLVVGTGDASESKIKDWAKSIANLRPSSNSDSISEVPAPRNSAVRRLQIIDKPDRTQTQIYIGQIGIRMTDSDFFPLYLGNYAFGGPSFSARLMVEIRVKRGWSYGADSHFRFGLQPRSWQVHLFPASKDAAAALAESLKLIDELKKTGIKAEEFEFSKQSIVNSAGFMYNTPRKRVENKLLEKTLDLPDGFMKSYGPEIAKVQLPDVNSSLAKFLKPNQLAISVLATAKDLKPALSKAAGVSEDAVIVAPYTQE